MRLTTATVMDSTANAATPAIVSIGDILLSDLGSTITPELLSFCSFSSGTFGVRASIVVGIIVVLAVVVVVAVVIVVSSTLKFENRKRF